ncbi:rab GTPase-activating protein 1-like [Salvelinus sp. IW2-2015]|uniref:rab GTPase-activating protein 1-like n=1 Tax=Salvelinus sp. IW2-2015 TaxID=2691554 RepID=UPI0038D3AEE4
MDDKASVGKISVSSDSVSTLNSEDFVLVSRLGDDTPGSSINNGSDDEKTGLKVISEEGVSFKIVGNGSEQQLQKELEDVLMDPSVADQILSGGGGGGGWGDQVGGGDHVSQPTTAVPLQSVHQPCPDPLSDPLNTPPKVEMVLPVQSAQGAQESELNERSYRGDESSSECSPSTPIPDEDSVVFNKLTYLGCASVNAPRSEVEALCMMTVLRGQCQLPLDVTLSVPGVSEGTVRSALLAKQTNTGEYCVCVCGPIRLAGGAYLALLLLSFYLLLFLLLLSALLSFSASVSTPGSLLLSALLSFSASALPPGSLSFSLLSSFSV